MLLKPFRADKRGYIQRSRDLLRKEGGRSPWRLRQNYLLDFIILRLRTVRDRDLGFRRGPGEPRRCGAAAPPLPPMMDPTG